MLYGEKPEQWSKVNIIPLLKSRDLSLASNYRGISLSSTFAKLINKMLLKRIQPKLDPHLRPNQNGFRPKRSTTAHILALRRLIEGVKHQSKSPNPRRITDYLNIRGGVLQGDTLAPYLFAIVIDYIMRAAVESKIDDLGFTLKPSRSRRIKSTKVSDLCFADDIAIISDEIWQAQEQLKNVEVEAIQVGLIVNGKKQN